MKLTAFLRTIRAGDARARLASLRSARHALTVAVTGSALRTGLLDELREPTPTDALAERRGWDRALTEALLASYAAHGLLRRTPAGWRTTAYAERVLRDDIVRAVFEAFATYHTGLYREIEPQLQSGGDRHDIVLDGELIARLSRFMDEFVLAELERVTGQAPPSRLLDVGCGAAAHLSHVLRSVPSAHAVGVETDPEAARLAREAVADGGLAGRAEIVEADVRHFLAGRPDERFDLVLLANVIYYVPFAERVRLLGDLADRLDAGGRLLVVTTALTDDAFSRHFDLLLRAQGDGAELPDMEVLAEQLWEAGLEPDAPRRIAPGEPLTAVLAHRR